MKSTPSLFVLTAVALALSACGGDSPLARQTGAIVVPPPVNTPQPPLAATPKATCGPGSRPEPGMQGRIPREAVESGAVANGYTCNTQMVGAFQTPNMAGTVGGFKVERYVDAAGHDCAYYDTTLLFPTNSSGAETGVNVIATTASGSRKPVR